MDDNDHSRRLDQHLAASGRTPSRARARDMILRGFVKVNGKVCLRPAQVIADADLVELCDAAPGYVSRGGEKLSAALRHFAFDMTGVTAIDAGASTGGFTQVLLEHGAQHVYAIDVGHSQLHQSLRDNSRVSVMEDCDIRTVSADMFGAPIGAVTADLSFISLTKALPAVMKFAAPGAKLIALIKPQFELSPGEIGKGGIVRSAEARQRAVDSVRAFVADEAGWAVSGVIPSPIAGGSGNEEFLLGASKNG